MSYVDDSEVNALAIDLSSADERLARKSGPTVRNTALRVKKNMRRAASGHRFLEHLPSTISAERKGPLEWEIGFDKRGQGNLANILVYGSVNNAPVFGIAGSLRSEIPYLERQLVKAGEDSVLGGAE